MERNIKPFHMLMIEDDPGDVDLTREALNSLGQDALPIKLTVIEDAEEAVYRLCKDGLGQGADRPDLILLDLNMPKLSGFEVLERIKKDEKVRDIPVVVLTTSNAASDIDKSYRLGANSFVTKAKSFTEFMSIFKRLQDFWFRTASLPSR